ncbi:hypothetical protein P154DRAFT_134251 [Amniculicola lignicola CBS 123094]|uniref:DUF974-domain-containing protein n=1 Tax=Amniculicola lignicola CBS 123094 TaxID=1392246 RepID=A0A6A5WNR7_9PLEO|nr:hypothetical protein P154DRAFT_134251 [Amniculicola lignicola CBS 123094]
MAHQRAQSGGESLKTPHSVSLKVLRLSRPSLAHQYPLASSSSILNISPKASLAYPSSTTPGSSAPPDNFIISPVLNLPEAFGSAYVGETFSCTLCANNEVEVGDTGRSVSGVRIQADMQTPATPAGFPLDLSGAEGEIMQEPGEGGEAQSGEVAKGEEELSPGPGESLQKILRFELKEEGNHVLAVTVTYTETILAGEGKAASGKVRTFRKLYQFVAQQLLSVRTKAGELGEGKAGEKRFLLEAQLENMGEAAIAFEAVNINPKPPFKSTTLNWDMSTSETTLSKAPILNPRDVIQVAFLLEQISGEDIVESPTMLTTGDTRRVLGQLGIQWRSAMGDRGSLSTGWLTSRK